MLQNGVLFWATRGNGLFILTNRTCQPRFTPSKEEVEKAQRIVEAMEQAAKEGKGAVSLDGRLIDIASIRMAESVLEKAKECS